MGDRPILFSAPMVRALLAGTKTQTRRAIKPRGNAPSLFDGTWSDSYVLDPGNASWRERDVPIKPGDRLWVREAVRGEELECGQDGVRYRADDVFIPIANTPRASIDWLTLHTYRGHSGTPVGPWVPGIHMPRWASRLTLIVTDVRVQRLQDISEEDARAEGCDDGGCLNCGGSSVAAEGCCYAPAPSYRDSYAHLWDSINGAGSWAANPWVAAYTFTVHRQNIDAMPLPSARDAAMKEGG